MTAHDSGHRHEHGQGDDHGHGDDHGRGGDHGHSGGHDHGEGRAAHHWRLGGLRSSLRPHSHDHAESIDNALLASREGVRTIAVSLGGLLLTAALQAAVVAVSSSVGLLADTIHNVADALTALPLGLAFVVGRRLPTARYTYGFGRAEDLAGLGVVAVIAASAVVAVWESATRIAHHRRVDDLWWVAAAGVVGFAGNELVARYRIRTGRRIGSAALVADGMHARTDGFTSLAVVVGAGGQALGWSHADAAVGLAISVAIVAVLRGAARDVYRRLMDAVDPALVARVEEVAASVEGVMEAPRVRLRWIGHELLAEIDVTVDRAVSVAAAHDVAEVVQHRLLHELPRLSRATVHTDPSPAAAGPDPHRLTRSHQSHLQSPSPEPSPGGPAGSQAPQP